MASATLGNTSDMRAMDIESDSGARHKYLCNRARENKKYMIGAMVLVALVSVPLATTFHKRAAANSSVGSSPKGAATNSNVGSMSWPPPAVEMDDFDNLDGINTNRARTLLRDATNDGINSGVTILQKVDVRTENSVDTGTGDVLTNVDINMDENKIVATDMPNGGKKIEVTINHIFMTMTSSFNGQELLDVHYDSNTDGADLDPAFEALKKIVGHQTTIELDKHGEVVTASEHLALYKAMSSGQNADTMKKFSSQNRFNMMTRMAKALPDGDPVGPGDNWEFEMQMDRAFSGSAVLVGYKEYDNSDCAVVKLEGEINLDANQLNAMTNAMTEDMDQEHTEQYNQIMNGVGIKDGKMSAIFYWDYEHQLARFSKTVLTMTMSMTSPFDPSAKLDVPATETIVVYSSIVE